MVVVVLSVCLPKQKSICCTHRNGTVLGSLYCSLLTCRPAPPLCPPQDLTLAVCNSLTARGLTVLSALSGLQSLDLSYMPLEVCSHVLIICSVYN